MFWLYVRTGQKSDWLSILERLTDNIHHPLWRRKIAYFRVLFYLIDDSKIEKAKQELKAVGLVTANEDDIDILQAYVSLELDGKHFSTKIVYLDRILELSKERANQIQYRGAKAAQYFLIGDQEGAENEISEAISLVRRTEDDEPLTDYERDIFGRLLKTLGFIRRDSKLLDEAIGHFNTLLLENEWTQAGRASIHSEIGECYKHTRAWNDAEKSYRDALASADNSINRIYLAEILLSQDKIDEAAVEIDKIDRNSLNRHEFDDFVFTLSMIAIRSKNEDKLREAKDLLEALKTSDPYFTEHRLKLLLDVTNTLTSGNASIKTNTDSAPGGVASVFSSFLLLEPNVMGIGINFNAVIEYFLKKKPRK